MENKDTTLIKKVIKVKLDLCKELIEYMNVDLGETNIDLKYNNKLIDDESLKNTSLIESFNKNLLTEYSLGSSGMSNVQIGTFIPNANGFNIQNALVCGMMNCKPKSIGRCAKYVRLMLEAGGLNTTGRPVSACNYVNFLPKIGFRHIATITGKTLQAQWSSTNALPGDISVMSHGKHGHICMFTGVQWLSDFPQNNMWPYVGDGTCNIFRFSTI